MAGTEPSCIEYVPRIWGYTCPERVKPKPAQKMLKKVQRHPHTTSTHTRAGSATGLSVTLSFHAGMSVRGIDLLDSFNHSICQGFIDLAPEEHPLVSLSNSASIAHRLGRFYS